MHGKVLLWCVRYAGKIHTLPRIALERGDQVVRVVRVVGVGKEGFATHTMHTYTRTRHAHRHTKYT